LVIWTAKESRALAVQYREKPSDRLVTDEFEQEAQRAEAFEGDDLESDQPLTKPTSPIGVHQRARSMSGFAAASARLVPLFRGLGTSTLGFTSSHTCFSVFRLAFELLRQR
jgi:hypothetical protein